MTPKNIRFEDLKDLNYGDQIIMEDPLRGGTSAYVLMSNIDNKSFYFIDGVGASLMVDSQNTIDGFNVKLIDETHPNWNSTLSEHGKELGSMLDQFKLLDDIKEE